MDRPLFTEQEYHKIVHALPLGEYENCVFHNCDLSGDNLAGYFFTDCRFEDCNISGAGLSNTAFRNVSFKSCKMVGLAFYNCSKLLFEVHFDDCRLNASSFYSWKLKKTVFRKSNLGEVDFSDADLSECVFDDCELTGAIFENTVLSKADLRKAWNFVIDPSRNTIKKAKFSPIGLSGLLTNYDILIED